MLARAPADTLQPTDIQRCGVLAGRLLLQLCCLVTLFLLFYCDNQGLVCDNESRKTQDIPVVGLHAVKMA